MVEKKTAAAAAVEASVLLRRRLCDSAFIFAPLRSSPDGNYRFAIFLLRFFVLVFHIYFFLFISR